LTVTHPFFDGTIENVLIDMKKNARSDYTINFTRKALNRLAQLTTLNEPEAVKMIIADLKDVSNAYKRNLCIAYNKYAKFYGLTWIMPQYKQEEKVIALPTHEKLQMFIANARRNLSMKLQASLETGIRPVELARLKVKDLDLEHNRVNPTTAKNGKARSIPISEDRKSVV
jgi:integrase